MRSFWRGRDTPINSHAEWLARLDAKNRRRGTSAPTLASAWAGLVEVLGALRANPTLAHATVNEIVVEAQSSFDTLPGGRRNHDLVVHGHLPDGERVVVCVEAKAGETLGPTVEQYRKEAEAKRARGERTNAPERIADLVTRFVSSETEDVVRSLRYQLLSALAGSIAAAASAGAEHCVLLLHQFLTDERPGSRAVDHGRDLRDFCAAVFRFEPPDEQRLPWCHEVSRPSGMAGRLYIARAVTDLRTETLEGPATRPA